MRQKMEKSTLNLINDLYKKLLELGNKLSDLSRNDKQKAIRLLDDQGAFILRRAVEDVADAMKVSRITVYNYLNALHR